MVEDRRGDGSYNEGCTFGACPARMGAREQFGAGRMKGERNWTGEVVENDPIFIVIRRLPFSPVRMSGKIAWGMLGIARQSAWFPPVVTVSGLIVTPIRRARTIWRLTSCLASLRTEAVACGHGSLTGGISRPSVRSGWKESVRIERGVGVTHRTRAGWRGDRRLKKKA